MLHHKNENGYTLIELMIAVAIGIVLLTSVAATYIAQNRSYTAQESVAEINTQSKIAHDIIAKEIKSGGFGNPENMNIDPINGATTMVIPSDSTNGPDAITVVGGLRQVGTLWPDITGAVTCPRTIPLGSTNVRITYSGTEGVDLTGRRYISIDGVHFLQVAGCTLVGADCDQNSRIVLDRPLPMDVPLYDTTGDGNCDLARPVYLVEDTTFCVDANNVLRRIRRGANPATCAPAATSGNDAIAENIEDLQFAYAVDADGNGRIDNQDANPIINGADYLDGNNPSIVADPGIIRAVRINVLARADRPDPNFTNLGSPPPQIENRTITAPADSFRRRWWQSLVKIRNE